MNIRNVILIRNAASYDFGGGERFPVFLADVLDGNNFNPVVISRNPKLLAFANNNGIQTVRGWWWSRQNWSGWRALLFPVYITWQAFLYLWYLQLFIKVRPTAVHIQSKDDFIAATYAASTLGINAIWTDHADLKHIWLNLGVKFKNPVGKWVYLAAKHASAITVVSKSEYSQVTNHLKDGMVKSKITVVYNGVGDRLAEFEQAPKAEFTFCIVSRLVTDKGIGEAIEAFDDFSKKYPASKLVVVGNGPQEDEFITKAAGVAGVELTGYQAEPLSYLANCDVFMQPTYHEGFSVSLVEATMMQKPIIATNVGGNPEIITDGQTGLLVPAKSPAALFAAMEKLYTDELLRNKLANNARQQYLQKFVFNKIVTERFIPLYEKNTD